MSQNIDKDNNLFVEIFHPSKQQLLPPTTTTTETSLIVSTTDAYVITLHNPKECASLIKHLSNILPLSSSLSHLKRVQRIHQRYDDRLVSTQSSTETATPPVISTTTGSTDNATVIPASSVSDCVTIPEQSIIIVDTMNGRTKRHKNVAVTTEDDEDYNRLYPSNDSKRIKTNTTKNKKESRLILKVLLGTKSDIEERFGPDSTHWINHQKVSSSNTTTGNTDDTATSNITIEVNAIPTLLSSTICNQYDDISILFTSCQFPNAVQDTIEIVPVPKGMPRSELEWKYCNDTIWPTTYIPNQMEENKMIQEMIQQQLYVPELMQMEMGIQAAIQDATKFHHDLQYHNQTTITTTTTTTITTTTSTSHTATHIYTHDSDYCHNSSSSISSNSGGVVIVCPNTGQILATAHDEYTAQQPQLQHIRDNHDNLLHQTRNPLMTPYIYAIQGISRIERRNMMTFNTNVTVNGNDIHDTNYRNNNPENNMNQTSEQPPSQQPPPPPQQQYLCTGYDVYGTIEPNIYEAMALVHSRIRRLVFGRSISDVTTNTNHTRVNRNNSGILDTHVHALPSTNHHYRAFMCQPNSPLWHQCCPEKRK